MAGIAVFDIIRVRARIQTTSYSTLHRQRVFCAMA
jgi:hypothetical protein